MRKLIRLMAGLVVLSMLAVVAPPPASATHWGPAGSDTPSGGVHEAVPDPAVVVPQVACVVAGEVNPGTVGARREEHTIPGNQATHSHFTFIDANITCTDEGQVDVAATGGNDGHTFDIGDSNTIELPPKLGGGTGLHPSGGLHGRHHGSTNDSGWSNSSGYVPGSGGAPSNTCAWSALNTDNGSNRNKANITVDPTGTPSRGWIKYYRVGVVLYVWGCFTNGKLSRRGTDGVAGTIDDGANPAFSAVLAIFPPSGLFAGTPNPNFPLCLVPEINIPILPPPGPTVTVVPVTPQPPPCGFSIAGAAVRGPQAWLLP